MKKLLVSLLAVVLLAGTLAACKDNNTTNPSGTTGAGGTNSAEITTGEQMIGNLPKDLDFDGATVNIIVRDNWQSWIEGDGENSDIIWSSIYESNQKVDAQLNIKRVINKGSSGQEEFAQATATAVLAGLNENDVIVVDMYYGTIYSTTDTYADLNDGGYDQYLDTSSPWWYGDFMENIVVGNDKMYMLAGDISPSLLSWASGVLVNRKLFADNCGDYNEFLNKVVAGEWYLEDMTTYISKAFIDVNTNGQTDGNDILGFSNTRGHSGCYFALNFGMEFTNRLDDGTYELVMTSDRNVEIFDSIFDLYHNTEGVYIYYTGGRFDAAENFASGGALFMPHYVNTAWNEDIRNMDDPYFLVPYPKYDETQENYIGTIMDSAQLFAVPNDIFEDKIELVAAFLEAQCYQNYTEVTPAIYEGALKNKYMDDGIDREAAIASIEAIRNSVTAEFAFIYNTSLGYPVKKVADLIEIGDATFASTLGGMTGAVQAKLDSLHALFLD